MLGSRIDPTHLRRVIDRRTWWVMQPGTGSAYWYLAFKNHVLGAGVTPKAAIFFFRDDNLTDVLFRVEEPFRWSLDTVAGPHEPELDAAIARRRRGGWAPVHALAERVYRVAPAAARADAWLAAWPIEAVAGERRKERFQKEMNDLFAFERLRPMAAADMSAWQARPGFHDSLPGSILPELVALARERGVKLAFVRVQRRPLADGPPPQTPELRRYIGDLRAWLESQGAMFIDETGRYSLDWYKDGDHMQGSRRREYTERFAQAAAPLFR